MKIIMFANDTNFIYNLRREILSNFINKGFESVIVAKVIDYKTELEEIGCKVIDVNTYRHSKNPLNDLMLYTNIYKIIKEENPNIVFTNNIKPNVYAGLACKRLNIPYVTNVTGLGNPVENTGVLQKLTTMLYKIGVSNANTIFFQNEENQDFFSSRNLVSKKTNRILIPGSGVNLDTHKLSEYPMSDVTIFLFVARIMKEKGIEQYLYTAEKIKNKHPDTEFWICGDCDDEKYIEIIEAAEQKGFVKYFGHQTDMDKLFVKCGCLIHPSYYPEGMSNVILEAAAIGRPVITTNRSGCREAVDDGVTGYVVPVKGKQALVDAVEKFLSLSYDERKQMGIAGRRKMEREFDRRLIVDKYNEVYNGCV